MSEKPPSTAAKVMLWAGYAITCLVMLSLTLSGIMKVTKQSFVVDEFVNKFGYSEKVILIIGIVELICTAIYIFPRTAVIGAILLTGYLGGATATHVRVDDPFWGPVVVGVLVWLGLFFRDQRLRALLLQKG